VSNDEKLKSARGRPEIERGCEDDGLNPKLPPTGPVDTRWDEDPRIDFPIEAPRAPAPKGMQARQPSMDEPAFDHADTVTRTRGVPQDDPGQPARIPAAPQPGDPAWLVELKVLLRGSHRASREAMQSGQAYIGLSFCRANDEEIEVVWEIGVGRLNATKGEGEKQGPAYETRDLWGRGGSLEDAVQTAHTEKNPRGGRRG
jgi:hypothetical protein